MPSSTPASPPPGRPPSPLRSRTFTTLLGSEFVSLIGDRLVSVALVTLVYDLTRSPSVVALLMLAKAVPALLLGGLAGSIVDRLDRKWVLVGSNAIQGLIVLAIPATNHLGIIVGSYLAMSVVNQFFVPARASTLPDIVGPDSLVRANALFGLAFVGAIAVGPAIGGWVAETFGLDAAFYVDAASFVVPALAVATLTLPTQPRRETRAASTLAGTSPLSRTSPIASTLTDARDALAFARTDAPTRVALGTLAGASLIVAVLSILGVVVARDALALGAAGYGLMMSAMGAGMLAAALVLGRRRGNPGRLAPLGLALAGSAAALLAWLGTPALAMAASALVGAGVLTVQISGTTVLQSAPPDLRTRVLSLNQSVTGLAQLVAIGATAALAVPLGSAWVLCGAGFVAVAAAVLLFTIGRSAS